MDLNLKEVSINENAEFTLKSGETKSAKQGIIDWWDVANDALEALKAMIKNPIVKLFIGIVQSVGNKLYHDLTGTAE